MGAGFILEKSFVLVDQFSPDWWLYFYRTTGSVFTGHMALF
jgi:hypothetical protein